ncbi:hypothetical protein L7F22_025648 [Adiantum nelumboides]|nr:hypothetical protein [Adiantum nelumboides]
MASQAYRKAVDTGDEYGPFLVAEDISKASFEEWVISEENSWRVAMFFQADGRGAIFFYGDPTELHETVSWWIHDEFVLQVGRKWKTLVRCLGSEPDNSYTSASSTSQLRRVTVEVAYWNEDLRTLIKEVADWSVAGVALSIGVKIQAGNLRSGQARVFHVKLYWVQQTVEDKAPNVIEFSPNVCKEENKVDFVDNVGYLMLFASTLKSNKSCMTDFATSLHGFLFSSF